jgi:hypothetical protein
LIFGEKKAWLDRLLADPFRTLSPRVEGGNAHHIMSVDTRARKQAELNKQIKSLSANFSGLIRSGAIGSVVNTEDGSAVPPVASRRYDDASSELAKQELASAVHAENLVHSCQSLLQLCASLKSSILLHDEARVGDRVRERAQALETAHQRNEHELTHLEADVRNALGTLENHLDNSLVAPA